jgi:hypothetical protein
MISRLIPGAFGLLFIFHSVVAIAQLDAHEHGSANLNLAIDGNRVFISFESPAINIVGFEHPPHDDSQHAAIEQAKAALIEFETIFNFAESANCHLSSASSDWLGEHEEEGHEEHEDGVEDHSEEEVTHTEFAAEYNLDCKNMSALDKVNVLLFKRFQNILDIDVQAITPNGQFAFELDKENTLINLK